MRMTKAMGGATVGSRGVQIPPLSKGAGYSGVQVYDTEEYI